MADQVNPMGSLAPGLLLTPAAPSKSQPVQENARVVKPADLQPHGPDGRPADAPAALDSAAQSLSDNLQQRQSDLMFQVDKSSGRTFFKIVDSKTGETIRQVPSEEILAMARKLREVANPKGAPGVLVDQEG